MVGYPCECSVGESASVTYLKAGQFYGDHVRERRDAGLSFSEVNYPPSLDVPQHVHEPGYFCLLVNGSYWEQYGPRRVEYTARSVVFHPPGETHCGRIGEDGGRCFNIEMSAPWMERLQEHTRIPTEAVDRHSGELVWLALRLYRGFRSNASGSSLTVEGIALELLGELARQSRDSDPSLPAVWLRKVEERLREEYASPLTIAGMAEDIGVNAVRLARAFRREYGEGVGDRLRRIRVQRAGKLLLNTDRSLSSIAFDVGFADQSHFTRSFKRLTGMTPGSYREEAGR